MRTTIRSSLIAIAAFIFAGDAIADESNVRRLPEGAKPGAATITQVSWLEGRWVGEGFGGQLEEIYSPATNDSMIGHFQMTKDGAAQFFEFVEIRQENGSLVYRVKHFNPDLTGWEEKDKYVSFKLVAIEGDTIYFDGLTIERVVPDTAIHWILLGRKGELKVEKLVYRRVTPLGP